MLQIRFISHAPPPLALLSWPPWRTRGWRNGSINAQSASRRINNMEPFSKLIAEYGIEAERDYCRLLK